ncbi:hypothetical protein [Blastococcus sp. PRF04-17]|uniref:hypothetical protein n=1 Tax=Blastococcus sp. PRF04-17 TaxID=2933797 RepID=UPI001FF59755|nr:hypothetical protein [Blastococcus sp. PRF04-17]UOY02048.1 hypothetical protein MVA48_01285 [Blastococcus sp. PRF04-17]
MARGGVIVGVIALLGLGGYAALPDRGPEYLGDMPSILEQAEAAPAMPTEFVPPPLPPPPEPVEGPSPVAVEAPPPIPAPPAAERNPAPVTDAPSDFTPGAGDRGANGPGAGLLDFLDDPIDGALVCVGVDTIFRPGVGLVDCLTGEVLEPVEPPDPCAVLPLPVGCPDPELPELPVG